MMVPRHRPNTHLADVTRLGHTERVRVWRTDDGDLWMSERPVHGYYFHHRDNVKLVEQ
jgi:hypothetical protein